MPKEHSRVVGSIQDMIKENQSSGYETFAYWPNFNKTTALQIFQLKRWQVKEKPLGSGPRMKALSSVEMPQSECWSTDLCSVWAGCDGRAVLTLVIDCNARDSLGWHLPRSSKARIAGIAPKQALITRFDTLARTPTPALLRSDNGSVLISRTCTELVRSYGLDQGLIRLHRSQENRILERFMRTLKKDDVSIGISLTTFRMPVA